MGRDDRGFAKMKRARKYSLRVKITTVRLIEVVFQCTNEKSRLTTLLSIDARALRIPF
jgi:hypothetical protein